MIHVRRFIISIVIWNAILSFFLYVLGHDLGTSAIIALSIIYILDKALEHSNIEKGVKVKRGMMI